MEIQCQEGDCRRRRKRDALLSLSLSTKDALNIYLSLFINGRKHSNLPIYPINKLLGSDAATWGSSCQVFAFLFICFLRSSLMGFATGFSMFGIHAPVTKIHLHICRCGCAYIVRFKWVSFSWPFSSRLGPFGKSAVAATGFSCFVFFLFQILWLGKAEDYTY